MEAIIVAAVIALVIYALERNHRKHPAPRLFGSTSPFTSRTTPRTPGA